MGKLSFSIYLTHEISIAFLLNLPAMASPTKPSGLILYAAVMGSTIVVAFIFYKVIEEPFVKLKDKLDLLLPGKKAVTVDKRILTHSRTKG